MPRVGAPRAPFDMLTGHASESVESSDATLHVHEAVARAASAMFVDAHNTGFYINAYTTKSNPGMDNVMQKLLAGLRRLKDQWDAADSAAARPEDVQPDAAPAPADAARGLGQSKRQEAFRRTAQLLSQFESSVRRASWKSGTEIAYPMLFGRMALVSH